MLAKKKKLTKKQIKEDKLVTSYYQFQQFYEENQTKILIVVGAVAAIILAVFWYTSKIEQENLSATAQLTKVIHLYEDGNYAEAISGQPGTNILGLQEIVREYGGTDQGEVARVYLANSLYATGKIDEAYEQYSKYSGSNSLLAAAALAGKGACLENKQQFDEAADNYFKAYKMSESNPQNSDYLLLAVKNYVRAGNKSEAKNVMEILKSEYKNSQAANEVEKYSVFIES
ncbi:MAG: hypothetical protein JW995_10840 [Melioribacteraceae bacterium]|nr:hypothetical protein [Melioribacteraceae bacterium]